MTSVDRSVLTVANMSLGDQIALIRRGLPTEMIGEVSCTLGMTAADLMSFLPLSCQLTTQRTKTKLLTVTDSEILLRVAKALTRADAIFESREASSNWLKRKIRSLGGVAPLSLLDTSTGLELVMQTLARIEHGVCS